MTSRLPRSRTFAAVLTSACLVLPTAAHGVGRSRGGKAFQRRLASGLGLPIEAFNCTGRFSGTMTSWHNARFRGTAITVELGSSPARSYLREKATRGTLRAVLGRR